MLLLLLLLLLLRRRLVLAPSCGVDMAGAARTTLRIPLVGSALRFQVLVREVRIHAAAPLRLLLLLLLLLLLR